MTITLVRLGSDNVHSKHSRDNPHFKRYARWKSSISQRVRAQRSGMATLARAIGVSRQTVHRWFTGQAEIPAWAAFAISQWWQVHNAEYPATLYAQEA